MNKYISAILAIFFSVSTVSAYADPISVPDSDRKIPEGFSASDSEKRQGEAQQMVEAKNSMVTVSLAHTPEKVTDDGKVIVSNADAQFELDVIKDTISVNGRTYSKSKDEDAFLETLAEMANGGSDKAKYFYGTYTGGREIEKPENNDDAVKPVDDSGMLLKVKEPAHVEQLDTKSDDVTTSPVKPGHVWCITEPCGDEPLPNETPNNKPTVVTTSPVKPGHVWCITEPCGDEPLPTPSTNQSASYVVVPDDRYPVDPIGREDKAPITFPMDKATGVDQVKERPYVFMASADGADLSLKSGNMFSYDATGNTVTITTREGVTKTVKADSDAFFGILHRVASRIEDKDERAGLLDIVENYRSDKDVQDKKPSFAKVPEDRFPVDPISIPSEDDGLDTGIAPDKEDPMPTIDETPYPIGKIKKGPKEECITAPCGEDEPLPTPKTEYSFGLPFPVPNWLGDVQDQEKDDELPGEGAIVYSGVQTNQNSGKPLPVPQGWLMQDDAAKDKDSKPTFMIVPEELFPVDPIELPLYDFMLKLKLDDDPFDGEDLHPVGFPMDPSPDVA